ncbi:Glycerol kinase [Batrachochytrium dendrobatidis]|nr:Glycerol kinase [Batrachochytrium dendrobatidis]
MDLRYEYYLRRQKAPWGLYYFHILDFTDTHRTFRKYRNYYELLTEMPRFKHCTISFRRMRDIIPQIRKWFNQQCQALPGTHILSRGFWRSKPTEYHNFDCQSY